jgi:hypothetical protein
MKVPVVVGPEATGSNLRTFPGAAELPQTWTVFLELANLLELLEALRNRRAQGRERLLRHLGGKLEEFFALGACRRHLLLKEVPRPGCPVLDRHGHKPLCRA